MIKALKSSFENDITNCLVETSDTLVEIYDCYDCIPPEQRSYIKTRENEPIHFTLYNSTASNIVFAALDNCIFKSHEQSRCDFIIGNFKKLYFVEIKQVNKGQRRSARATANQQLHNSLSFFKERINFKDTELIAVVCLKAKQVHPLQSAKRTADIVAFKEFLNASLTEGQSHTF